MPHHIFCWKTEPIIIPYTTRNWNQAQFPENNHTVLRYLSLATFSMLQIQNIQPVPCTELMGRLNRIILHITMTETVMLPLRGITYLHRVKMLVLVVDLCLSLVLHSCDKWVKPRPGQGRVRPCTSFNILVWNQKRTAARLSWVICKMEDNWIYSWFIWTWWVFWGRVLLNSVEYLQELRS